jgi:hypothetical protein
MSTAIAIRHNKTASRFLRVNVVSNSLFITVKGPAIRLLIPVGPAACHATGGTRRGEPRAHEIDRPGHDNNMTHRPRDWW